MVFLVTAVAIGMLAVRPRHVPAYVWPVSGALFVMLLGAEPVAGAGVALARQWNILLFIAGLMCVASAAQESGAFEFITNRVLDYAGGSRRVLFVYLFLAGSVLTIVLSNDATAIVLTPVVYRAVAGRGGDAMPFLFGCIFVADTASFGAPFSNPANVLVLPHARLPEYLWHLGPPEIAAIAINLGLFLFFFRTSLRGHYDREPPVAPRPRALATLFVFGLLGIAYLAALAASLPLGPIAAIGGIAALLVARVPFTQASRQMAWETFALLAGLFVLLDSVARAGLTGWALRGLSELLRYGPPVATVVAGVAAALLSNVLNNLPVAIASASVVQGTAAHHVAYPLIAGIDLGPNLTTAGSLATILWLAVLHERGVRVNLLEYLRLGAIVVPPTLGATLLWLVLIR
jgi:arsenical pump membrane protein